MTSSRFLGWRFKGRTPLWFWVILGLLLLDSALHFGLLFTVSAWALPTPDALHSYRVPFRDGRIYFAPSWLGLYLDAKWIGIVLLLLLFVTLVLKRDHLERGG